VAGRFSVEAVFKAVDRVTAPVTRMQNRIGKMTRGLERGLRKIDRLTGKVVGGLKRAAFGAAKFGGALLGAASAAAVVAINKVADSADELAKRTRRIKFPIQEFQEWQFVAEQSGLTTAEFDKSMEKFTKTVGEARAGTGTLFTILKKTNKPLLQQLKNADNAADAFDIYIKALRNTENQMDKTALATAGFGRTGAKFLNITEQSADAIKALRKEQRENGIITKQQAAAAEAYNDSVNSLQRSLGGLLQSVILPMLPVITKTVREWRQWVVANREMLASRALDFIKGLREQLGAVTNIVTRAVDFMQQYGGTILKVVAGVVALSVVVKTLIALFTLVNLVMAANPITLIVAGVALLVGAFAALVIWIDDIAKGFDRMNPIIRAFYTPLELIIRAIKFIKDAFTGGFGSAVAKLAVAYGFGGDDDEAAKNGAGGPQVVSPQERAARHIEESRTTSTADVTIKDETGRAEVTRGKLGAGLQLQTTGAL
jgi:hypothetical protein